MTAVAYRRTFADAGTFVATRAAEAWCKENGISVGTMQGPDPRGLLVGDFYIAKWRNLSRDERAALHGTITGNGREGPVHVELFANCPPITGVIA
jgi:hypothetical protein